MEAIDAIMTRRSVRKFKKRQIPDAVLEKIIQAGTYAPSALALQPWGFVVVQEQVFLTRVSDYCKPIMISHMKEAHDGMSDAFLALLEGCDYSIYYHAPTVIMVVGKSGSRFREIDCSLCAENVINSPAETPLNGSGNTVIEECIMTRFTRVKLPEQILQPP